MEGQAALQAESMRSLGWTDLLGIHFLRFDEIGLLVTSTDREAWRRAQTESVLLLTANRSMTGQDSQEETIRQENTLSSLPVLTVGVVERLEVRSFREEVADRIAEIIFDLDRYLGVGRLFVP
jgi:hypothetical protein